MQMYEIHWISILFYYFILLLYFITILFYLGIISASILYMPDGSFL
jgi:hypothetical protein